MNGCVIPYTPIAVDFWKVRQCPRVRLFFLSHVHLESSCGITSAWSLPIYCSAISKKLLIHQFQLNPDVVHELELGVPHIISLTPNGDVTMTVTLIDANHCPGSVMFLFDGYFGRILYTGDFRYSEAMLTSGGLLGELVTNPIDVLYLDNTFCSPKCAFPPHEEALKSMIAIIKQHPNERVMFGMRSLGKEDMLIAISECFNEKISISAERYKVLQLLDMHERFVICGDSKEAKPRFEVVSLVEVTRTNVDAWNKSSPTIAILPTALFEGLGFQPFVSSPDIFVVPYSDHSPFSELHQFVSGIRPKSVIPIVRADVNARDDPLAESLLDRASIECFADCLDRTPMQNYHIPASVIEMMNQNSAGGGQVKKRAPRNGSRQLKSKTTVPRVLIGSTEAEQTSLRKVSISSDNLESCIFEAADIAGATNDQTASVERQISNSSLSSTSATPVLRATHASKPHVLVRPIKRCSSSDRLLALAMRPSSHFLKQRHGRVSVGTPTNAHSSVSLPQSCVRPKSTVASVSPLFSVVRGRRERPLILQNRIPRCHGINDSRQISARHSIELNSSEEAEFAYTDMIRVPSESSSQEVITDAPLNLSQSAILQVPVSSDVYDVSADRSNGFLSSGCMDQHGNRDYSQCHVGDQNASSASSVTSSAEMNNCDCAAIAVSSLLSLSNGDANNSPFTFLPTHLGTTQAEIVLSYSSTWQCSTMTEALPIFSSVCEVASECVSSLSFSSTPSTQKSSLPNYTVNAQIESVEMKLNEENCADGLRCSESVKLTDFQHIHRLIDNSDVSGDLGSYGGSRNSSSLLPLQATAIVDSNSPSCVIQQRLHIPIDKETSHCSDGMSTEEPHDYSMTSTTVTDSFCMTIQPLLTSSANRLLVCSAPCWSSMKDIKITPEADAVGTSHWADVRVSPVTSVVGAPFLSSSSAVMFECDILSNSSDSMSSLARCDGTEITLPRSDTGMDNFSASANNIGVMLPPKKNWRRRYHRSSQLSRAHQENKRFHGHMDADSDRTEGRRSPAIKRSHSRGRLDAIHSPGQSTDGKSILSEEVDQDAPPGCESNRPSKRPPLVASHFFHHLPGDGRLQAVEKSVLKSNPANMRRHSATEESVRQIACSPSTALHDTPVKRVTRSMWESKVSCCLELPVCRQSTQPAVSIKQLSSVVESCKPSNCVSTISVASSVPLDLSVYQNVQLDSGIGPQHGLRR